MIAVRSERTDITNILLEGKHINLDIQENVSSNGLGKLHSTKRPVYTVYSQFFKYLIYREQDGQLSTSLLREETQLPQKHYSRQELMLSSKTMLVFE